MSQRLELVKLCNSRDWSKAIRVLDSLLAQSCTIQDICNRAFCYSQLELNKHTIKDCDKALQLDPTVIQAYILKGHAFYALGKKEEALLIWEQGYERALCQPTDLKQLLELEVLLDNEKQNRTASGTNHVIGLKSSNLPEFELSINCKPTEACLNQSEPNYSSNLSSTNNQCEVNIKPSNSLDINNGTRDKVPDSLPDSLCESKHFIDGKSSETPMSSISLNNESKSQNKLGVTSQIDGSYCSDFDAGNRCSNTFMETEKFDIKQTQNCDTLDKLNQESDSHDDLSRTANASESLQDSSNTKDLPITSSDETKGNTPSIARISKTKSISVDFRLSRAICEVNEGKYARAISIFDQILRDNPTYHEALVGRGTAYAFKRELDTAIVDFSKAIELKPSTGEAWKRRGQARAALGEFVEAIEDLSKAFEFEENPADLLHERGIVNYKFKDFNAAVQDLSACVQLDQNNKSAYTYLGSALSSIGEYKRAEEALRNSIQLDQNFLEGWGHLAQFFQDFANPAMVLECLQHVLKIDERFAKAFHMRGVLFHGMGEHRKAVEEFSIGLGIESSNMESIYLRASCYHAIGEYGKAAKDYDSTLDLVLDSMDKFVLQCLSFYQKEIALYTASRMNRDFSWFEIDRDTSPVFKEYWCKKLHPKDVCEKVFRQPPLSDSHKKGYIKKQDLTMTKQKTALLVAADSIGKKIQYNCPGFLHNRRQHRMAGLAAIQIAQKVSKAWRSLQAERKNSNKSTPKHGKRTRRKERTNTPSHNRGGDCCSTANSSETSTSTSCDTTELSGRSMMSWHDLYSLAVRWRQISEPCDSVVWLNKLSEDYDSGFGSCTPLIMGQQKVVRYYPHFERTLDIAKNIVKENSYVNSKMDWIIDLSKDKKLEDFMLAKTCSDLYKVVGEDFWLATWCSSSGFEGKRLEGTRITLAKTEKPGIHFAIRTPYTPSRWSDYDVEMKLAWDAICNSYCSETYGSMDINELEDFRDAILKMTFYWYNFMPLSRGSAVVGFIVMLGLLLAANMEFIGEIPSGVQVDWEAILNLEPNSFVDSVKKWLYPSLKLTTSWKDYPDVSSTFYTTGSVVAALSFCSSRETKKKIEEETVVVVRNRKEMVDASKISELPDDILGSIVFRLTMKEAAATSVLSRRWRNLWTTNFTLNFDDGLMSSYTTLEKQASERARFKKWVNLVLKSYKELRVDEFRLRFQFRRFDSHCINMWIEFAIAKQVKRLILDFQDRPASISMEVYRFPEIHDNVWTSLRYLELRKINVSQGAIDYFLSNCPHLEELTLQGSDFDQLEVVGDRLKCLTILWCNKLKRLRLLLPNLSSFTFDSWKIDVVVADFHSLTELSAGQNYSKYIISNYRPPLNYLSHLQTLKLQMVICPEVLSKLQDFPVLPMLKRLTLKALGNEKDSVPFLALLLMAAPSLHKLVLELSVLCGWHYGRGRAIAVEAPRYRHQCLKVVEILAFTGNAQNIASCTYLIANAVMLEKLIVDPTPQRYPEDIFSDERQRKYMDEIKERAIQFQSESSLGNKFVLRNFPTST